MPEERKLPRAERRRAAREARKLAPREARHNPIKFTIYSWIERWRNIVRLSETSSVVGLWATAITASDMLITTILLVCSFLVGTIAILADLIRSAKLKAFVLLFLAFFLSGSGLIVYLRQKPLVSQATNKSHAPDVTLNIANPRFPLLQASNISDTVARDIRYTSALFNIDAPNHYQPLPIRVGGVDFIKPHQYESPHDLFSPVLGMIKPGNRIFGTIAINCAECAIFTASAGRFSSHRDFRRAPLQRNSLYGTRLRGLP